MNIGLLVYKVNGERLKEKEIDLFKVVEQFDPDYIPTELGSVYSWNGRELVSLQIRSTKDNSVRKMMYLNLDTRKLERNETLNDHQRNRLPDFNVPIDEKSSIEELNFFKIGFD